MAYLFTILLTIICLILVVNFILNYYKSSKDKFAIIESNPNLTTINYDQHVRRLNKFRTSNYKGTTYFFSKKGGLYYYSKNNVRIYM